MLHVESQDMRVTRSAISDRVQRRDELNSAAADMATRDELRSAAELNARADATIQATVNADWVLQDPAKVRVALPDSCQCLTGHSTRPS